MNQNIHYEFFEHTADIGIIVIGETLEKLIENLVLVFSDLTTELSKLKDTIEKTISVGSENIEDSIIKLIEEVLFLFETERFLPSACSVSICENKILCKMKGDKFSPTIHPPKFIIKAITYHQFELKREEDLWKLKVVFDV